MKPKRGRGRPRKLGEIKPFVVRLPADLHRRLRATAKQDGKSLNDLMVDVLREWWTMRPTPSAAE